MRPHIAVPVVLVLAALATAAAHDGGLACVAAVRERVRAYYARPDCVHGLSCGHACDGAGYMWQDDALDLACHVHKRCLERADADACQCHTTLRAFAVALLNETTTTTTTATATTTEPEPAGKKCTWWEVLWCHEEDDPPPPPPPPPPAPPAQTAQTDAALTIVAGLDVQLVVDRCL